MPPTKPTPRPVSQPVVHPPVHPYIAVPAHAVPPKAAVKGPDLFQVETSLLRLARTLNSIAGPLPRNLLEPMPVATGDSREMVIARCDELTMAIRAMYPQMTFSD